MGQPFDLEFFREMFKDKRTHAAVAKIVRLEIAADGSALFAYCNILTQGREVVARVAWDACSSGGGDFRFPVANDLVLLTFAEGDDEQIFVTKRLSSVEDFIPDQAIAGHAVTRSHPAKKLYVQSDTGVFIGLPDSEPDEPLVLGLALQTLLVDILTQLSTQAEQISTLAATVATVADKAKTIADEAALIAIVDPISGPLPPPTNAAAFTAAGSALSTAKSDAEAVGTAIDDVKTAIDDLQASPVEDGVILSDIAFTEKGTE